MEYLLLTALCLASQVVINATNWRNAFISRVTAYFVTTCQQS